MQPVIIAPSLLASDFGKLAQEIGSAEKSGADWLHLDVMDGHFVDNISFGPAFVEAAHATATVPLDVHLMIDRPDHFFPRFTGFAKNISVHFEAKHDSEITLKKIRDAGCHAGLAIKPGTPLSAVERYLSNIDLLLIMTVEPGFGGQPFLEKMLEKIERAALLREQMGLTFHIEVDGGINHGTAELCVRAGANVLVAGNSVFLAPDRALAIAGIRGQRS